MKLELNKIRLDGNTQPRAELNQEIVGDYAESVMAGAAFPPIDVFHDGSTYWLADGFHRYFAHKRAGVTAIDATVHTGTLRDALLFSVGANSKHGLRRTNEDKRRAVMVLLNDLEWSEWSDIKIAETAGVSSATVHRIRKSLQLDQKTERKYIDKHGIERVMKTGDIGKKTTEPTEKTAELTKKAAELTERDDPITEIAAELTALAEENIRLKEMVSLGTMEIPEEEKLDIHEQLEQYHQRIRNLETENEAIRKSRDTLQNENAELIKQVHYWRKRCQKLEQKAA